MGPPGEALLTWPDSDGSMPPSRGKGSPDLLFLWEKDKTDWWKARGHLLWVVLRGAAREDLKWEMSSSWAHSPLCVFRGVLPAHGYGAQPALGSLWGSAHGLSSVSSRSPSEPCSLFKHPHPEQLPQKEFLSPSALLFSSFFPLIFKSFMLCLENMMMKSNSLTHYVLIENKLWKYFYD